MKKKGLLLVTSMLLVSIVAGAGVAYALWRSDAKNADNKVKIGEAVILTLGGTAYFDVELDEPSAASPITAITVMNPSEETYMLKIAEFAFKNDAVVNHTMADLYIEVSDDANMADPAKSKFDGSVILIASSSAASKTVYVRIGLGANPTVALADQEIGFSIVTAEVPQA
jgi:hypothetical protein